MNTVSEQDLQICRVDTLKHIHEVVKNLNIFITELIKRGEIHDASKLESPELEGYAVFACKLSNIEYGTPEYKKMLDDLKPVIEHHWSKNRHHAEHHKNGINDMDLVDLIEMISDWKAATLRNKNGNINKSLDNNVSRYGLTSQLEQILRNTINRYF